MSAEHYKKHPKTCKGCFRSDSPASFGGKLQVPCKRSQAGAAEFCLLVSEQALEKLTELHLLIQEQFQKNPDSYNGAVRENYTWSQDYTDLEVRVPVPKHVVKGKQVMVLVGGVGGFTYTDQSCCGKDQHP
ncbi:NudC domain-containing protein 3 [Saguinus oedipus]|uniref:NudC domain-containing protein 3 n=1 Tax=Saguinus oedipus TaxID=9490 RepID=A0ABQ9UFY2_SAGOE|nr:NudC domain-containing protein 3 [Saguinus oedipus]